MKKEIVDERDFGILAPILNSNADFAIFLTVRFYPHFLKNEATIYP
jgi:hypothetical protein